MEVLIVSKSFIIREAMEQFFKNEFKKYECSTLKEIDEVFNVDLQKTKYIIIDLEQYMVEDILTIKAKYKEIKVIVYDKKKNNSSFLKLISNDIDGYLTEVTEKEELVYIFNRISKGKKYYDIDSVEEVIADLLDSNYNDNLLLTSRENEVLYLVGDGLSNREIANKLYITENTIKKHITKILSKLDMRNRKDLIIYTREKSDTNLRYG